MKAVSLQTALPDIIALLYPHLLFVEIVNLKHDQFEESIYRVENEPIRHHFIVIFNIIYHYAY